MWFIIKNKFFWILKNPIYYIGAILVFFLVYSQCSTYLRVNYFDIDSVIEDVPVEYLGDADIMDGYIPMTEDELLVKGIENLSRDLIESIGVPKEQVNDLIAELSGLDKESAIKIIAEKHPYLGNIEEYFFILQAQRKATIEEANYYIGKSLADENYVDFFGRKYSDYLGMGIVFYSLILFTFFYSYDYKKDMYELLHTKPVSEWKYLLSTALSGVMMIGLIIVLITICFQIMLVAGNNQRGFDINTFIIWKYVLVCNLPIVLYISFLYLFVSGLFRTPLPSIPILFVQMLYSNSGIRNENGIFHYKPMLGSVLIRFPEVFFETKFSGAQYLSQILLIILTVALAIVAIIRWKRKRVW